MKFEIVPYAFTRRRNCHAFQVLRKNTLWVVDNSLGRIFEVNNFCGPNGTNSRVIFSQP